MKTRSRRYSRPVGHLRRNAERAFEELGAIDREVNRGTSLFDTLWMQVPQQILADLRLNQGFRH